MTRVNIKLSKDKKTDYPWMTWSIFVPVAGLHGSSSRNEGEPVVVVGLGLNFRNRTLH